MVTVIAIWLWYQRNWMHERRQVFDSEHIALEMYPTDLPNGLYKPPWSLRILGESSVYASKMLVRSSVSDAELERIRALYPEIPVERESQGPRR